MLESGIETVASGRMTNLEQLTLVLVRTRNPLNIGAVARAMQNFGVRDLRLVTPFEASFREARSAVGAGAVLGEAREFASVAEAVADCRLVIGTTAARRRELQQPLLGSGAGGRSGACGAGPGASGSALRLGEAWADA